MAMRGTARAVDRRSPRRRLRVTRRRLCRLHGLMAATARTPPPVSFPLTQWTRPLTAAERDADFKSDLRIPSLAESMRLPRRRIDGVRQTYLPEYTPGIAAFWHP